MRLRSPLVEEQLAFPEEVLAAASGTDLGRLPQICVLGDLQKLPQHLLAQPPVIHAKHAPTGMPY